jgi:transcriptional regulator with GAF, ATPase, and Fis domain
MLSICLCGTLDQRRLQLKRVRIPTPVRWLSASENSDQLSTADLFLQLGSSSEQTKAHSPRPPLTAIWSRVPADLELDLAIQDSLADVYGFVVGYTDAMHDLCRRIRVLIHPMARALDVRALVLGETGVGKELVARAIHRLGSRRNRPFVPINCAGIAPELALSELFGHVRGAFTSAIANRDGAVKAAKGGVLFLDEVADLPLYVQSQLLRVLEDRRFSPLGSDENLEVDSQILTATNKDLSLLVEKGAFRPDLYFRIAQTTIRVPSLAERTTDLELLVRRFWFAAGLNSPVDRGLLKVVQRREWPGNVRELRTLVEQLILLRAAGDFRSAEEVFDLPDDSLGMPKRNLTELRAGFEKDILAAVLRRTGPDTAAAARELGVTRRTIYNLLRKYHIRL